MKFKTILITILILNPLQVMSQPIEIGALADISGPSARVGNDCYNGYQLAAIDKDKFLKVFYGDNLNDAKVGLNEFKSMIAIKSIKAIVTTRSHIAMSFKDTSMKTEIPVVGIASHPKLLSENRFAFRFIANAKAEGRVLADSLIKLGAENLFLITLIDEAYLATTNSLIESLKNKNVSISKNIEVNPDESDFKTFMVEIKKLSPKFIFVNLGPTQLVTFIQKLKESGWRGQILSNFVSSLPDTRKSLGELLEGVIFAESEKGGPIFQANYEERFNSKPSQLSYSCFAAIEFINKAVMGKSKIETSKDLYSELLKISHLELPDGVIEIENREAQLRSIAYQIRGEKEVEFFIPPN